MAVTAVRVARGVPARGLGGVRFASWWAAYVEGRNPDDPQMRTPKPSQPTATEHDGRREERA